MTIYTRTGDTGTTSLFGGKRVLKCEELVDVYGSIDELNSWIGLIRSKIKDVRYKNFLSVIQSDLFTIGSLLAGWKPLQGDPLESLNGRVSEMEKMIDEMEDKLPSLKNFILPGGSELGSFIHIARGICRRVERQVVGFYKGPALSTEDIDLIIKYLNRLSDLFFMLARFINKQANVPEVLWSGKVKHK